MMVTPPRGGFLRPFGLGWFIREYLAGRGPKGSEKIDPSRGAVIDDIRAAYKTALLREYAEDMVARALEQGIELSLDEALRRIPQRRTSIRTHSFYAYFHKLKMLGWVEATGEQQPSEMEGRVGSTMEDIGKGKALVEVPQPRRFYRLTAKGRKAPEEEWSDPVVALYGYTAEERRGKGPPLPKPGSLPRKGK
jgi:DNA-binding PadR family transcriptional regulator